MTSKARPSLKRGFGRAWQGWRPMRRCFAAAPAVSRSATSPLKRFYEVRHA